MWKHARAVAAWMVILLLGAIVGGGAYVSHLLTQVDQLVAKEVRKKLELIAPDWEVRFDHLKFDPAGAVSLFDVQIKAKRATGSIPLLSTPRMDVSIDAQLWRDQQSVVLREVKLVEPKYVLFRDPHGHWNFQDGAPPINQNGVSATFVIENGELALGLQQVVGGPVTEVRITDINTQLRPQAHRRYQSNGQCQVQGFGTLDLEGLVDANTGAWQVSGGTNSLRISDSLLSQLAQHVPGGTDQLAKLGISPQQQPLGNSPFRLASSSGTASHAASGLPESTPVPALRADADIKFQVGQASKGQPLDYKVTAHIERGNISEAIIPVPLFDLTTDIEVTPQHVVIKKLSAANGESRLYVDADLIQQGNTWQKKVVVRAEQLALDQRIRQYLPPGLLKLHDLFRPEGRFALSLGIAHDGVQAPHIDCEFRAIDCSATFAQFPFPARKVQGTVRKEGAKYLVDLQGLAGQRPVTLKGYMIPAGPQTDAHFTVQATDVPVDDSLLSALNTPELHGAHSTVQTLHLTGRGDVTFELIRRPHVDDKFQMRLELAVRDGELRYDRFPMPLTSFSGKLSFDSQKRRAFLFTHMEARHGDALIRAEGVFDQETSPPMLALQMELLNIPIDSDLKQATLVANPALERIWTDYGLDGDVDVDRVEIGWIPGGNAVVSLYGMQWKNGRLKPKALPYSWENIAGAMQWVDNRLTIHSLHGWHGDTYLHIDGSTNGASAYIETDVSPEVRWHLHTDSLQIVKLQASEDLKRALPAGVQQVVSSLNISGLMDLQLGLDLKGWSRDDLVTAEWSSLLSLQGNRVFTGLQLQDVAGKVQILRGSWNGRAATADGYVELDTAKVLDLPLTNIKGPFKVNGNEVLVGSPGSGAESPFLEANRYRDRKITAEVFGGRVGLQSIVLMAPQRPQDLQYRVELKLEDAELAELARYRGIQQERLSGKLNGETVLTGMGTSPTATRGEGWIHITPAQLFELPVFAQMFSLINFRQPSDTAFNYAYGDFTVHNGIVDFSSIELYGPSLNLGGRGYVGYAGPEQSKLALDFYTHGKRKLLQPLTDRWMRIQVVGTVHSPVPLVQPRIPVLNDALEGFMRAVDTGNVPPPRFQRTTPQPIPPNAAREVTPQ